MFSHIHHSRFGNACGFHTSSSDALLMLLSPFDSDAFSPSNSFCVNKFGWKCWTGLSSGLWIDASGYYYYIYGMIGVMVSSGWSSPRLIIDAISYGLFARLILLGLTPTPVVPGLLNEPWSYSSLNEPIKFLASSSNSSFISFEFIVFLWKDSLFS